MDAYRLGSLDEVDALDLDASLDEAVTVVEWGEGWVEGLTDDRLEITLQRPRGGTLENLDDAATGERIVTLRPVGARWAGRRPARFDGRLRACPSSLSTRPPPSPSASPTTTAPSWPLAPTSSSGTTPSC